ncbi:hypothetical protein H8S33_09885 [Ornithinibacillus sp. BX22]|uniref:Peptidase M50 domain-containing protein n=2 Tax=Ornithinibacillus TaxID=484508 RepID=A0A923RIE4_9BACI|nr:MULTISPECIES: site-2 protease family protein [Ornithinibacillus]MBC5637116.1 hypothetical protein [Ornithinibacillus hominis]MBS3679673.1 hypothetical protein [Ornithinibacillus massiliensis]
MNTALLLIFLILVVAPLSNFVHEIGHLLGAKLAKADEITLVIGRGKKLFRLVFYNMELQIGRMFISSGYTGSKRIKPYSNVEVFYITLFGPLLNAIIVFICYLFYQSVPNTYLLIFMLYNCWLFVMNAIPYKVGKQESDGLIMVRALFQKNVY